MKTKQQLLKELENLYGAFIDWEKVENETGLHINKYYYGDPKIDMFLGEVSIVASNSWSENNFRLLRTFTRTQLVSILKNTIKGDE